MTLHTLPTYPAQTLLSGSTMLGTFGQQNYRDLVRLPEFRAAMLAAPEHIQSVAWSHLVASGTLFLDDDQWYALLERLLCSPETFDVRTEADSPEFFCPESWLRIQLIGEVNRWLDSKDNIPFLRARHTARDTAFRFSSWLTAGGVRRPIFHKGNGKYSEQFQQAIARACLRGMRRDQYAALVVKPGGYAEALYPLTEPVITKAMLTPTSEAAKAFPLSPAFLAKPGVQFRLKRENQWPFPHILGPERAVHGMVRQFGLLNLEGVMDVERGAALSEATVEKPNPAYALTPAVRAARLRAAAQFQTFIHAARAAIYAPEWIETYRAQLDASEDMKASALRPAVRERLDERRMYFTEFAYAQASIQLGLSTRHVRDSYEAWADADVQDFSLVVEHNKFTRPFGTLRRAMLDRFPEMAIDLYSADVTVVRSAARFVSAVTLLWYFIWVSPRLPDAGMEACRAALDATATTLFHKEGFDMPEDFDAAYHFIHAPLSPVDTDPLALPMARLGARGTSPT